MTSHNKWWLVIIILVVVCNVNKVYSLFEDFSLPCGEILLPSNIEYTSANNMFWAVFNNKETLGIIFAECEEDVVSSINYFRDNDITFRIRSGRHSYGGYSSCDGCVILDVSRMNDATVIDDKYLSIQAGVTNDITVNTLREYNKIIPHGACPNTGVSGLTAGGGTSYIMRTYGYTIDYLIGLRIVLANGQVKEIIDDDEKDEFLLSTSSNSNSNSNSKSSNSNKSKSNSKSNSNSKGNSNKSKSKSSHSSSESDSDSSSSSSKGNKKNNKGSNKNSKDDNDLLWAIKGNGHNNFGVITQLYYKTISNPNNVIGFRIVYQYNFEYAFEFLKIYQDFHNPDVNPNINKYISSSLNFFPIFEERYAPYYYTFTIVGIYFNYDNNNGINLIDELIAQLPYDYTDIELVYDYYNMYQDVIFVLLNTTIGYTYPTSRLNEHLLSDETMHVIIDYFSNNVIINNMFGTLGLAVTWFYQQWGDVIRENDYNYQESSFPYRNYVGNIEYAVTAFTESSINNAYSELLNIKNTILDYIGDYVYLNYMDSIHTDLSWYYPNDDVFNRLQCIKQKYDPNNLFHHPLSIPLP